MGVTSIGNFAIRTDQKAAADSNEKHEINIMSEWRSAHEHNRMLCQHATYIIICDQGASLGLEGAQCTCAPAWWNCNWRLFSVLPVVL